MTRRILALLLTLAAPTFAHPPADKTLPPTKAGPDLSVAKTSKDPKEAAAALIRAKKILVGEGRYACCIGGGGCDECAYEENCPCATALTHDMETKPGEKKMGVCAECVAGQKAGLGRLGADMSQVTLAQDMEKMPGMAKMSGMKMGMSKMTMMDMRATTNLTDTMSREGSGTSWLPDSTPIYGQMTMRGRDMLMAHGVITPRYVNVGSKRGDREFDAPNWLMGMFAHPLDGPSQAAAKSQIGVRVMLSGDPFTVGGDGYPLLFQTGETWRGKALVDRQHPHDFVSELAAVYSRRLDSKNSAYAYFGYPGEPALGPPTFMHRLIALDLPDAPLGHHWTDSAHITFGVATLGVKLGPKFKVEASSFTGREPDENRYSFDQPRFDSYSGRFSFNPDANNALQISYGYLKSPESREPNSNENRTTASWLYNRPLGIDSNFTTSLVWGLNNLTNEGKSNALLLEGVYQNGANSVFARFENVQKSGHEFDLSGPLEERKFKVGAYTAGYLRDVSHGKGIDAGVGAAVTVSTKPGALDSVYGSGSPVSFHIMFRLRPSRMNMAGMTGMDSGK